MKSGPLPHRKAPEDCAYLCAGAGLGQVGAPVARPTVGEIFLPGRGAADRGMPEFSVSRCNCRADRARHWYKTHPPPCRPRGCAARANWKRGRSRTAPVRDVGAALDPAHIGHAPETVEPDVFAPASPGPSLPGALYVILIPGWAPLQFHDGAEAEVAIRPFEWCCFPAAQRCGSARRPFRRRCRSRSSAPHRRGRSQRAELPLAA